MRKLLLFTPMIMLSGCGWQGEIVFPFRGSVLMRIDMQGVFLHWATIAVPAIVLLAIMWCRCRAVSAHVKKANKQ